MLVLWSRKDTYRRFINSMGIQAVWEYRLCHLRAARLHTACICYRPKYAGSLE